jgi:hypothetical protein
MRKASIANSYATLSPRTPGIIQLAHALGTLISRLTRVVKKLSKR